MHDNNVFTWYSCFREIFGPSASNISPTNYSLTTVCLTLYPERETDFTKLVTGGKI